MKLNRGATKARLTEFVVNDPAATDKSITYGMPVEGVPARGMFFGQVAGPLDIANMKANPKEYNDRFTIHGIAYVTAPGLTQDDAEDQVTDVFNILLTILAADPKLGGSVAGLRRAEMSQAVLDSAPDGDGEGYGAWITFEIACESRLT